MGHTDYKTIGRDIYPGHEVNLYCLQNINQIEEFCTQQRFRIIYVKDGHGIL